MQLVEDVKSAENMILNTQLGRHLRIVILVRMEEAAHARINDKKQHLRPSYLDLVNNLDLS